MEGDSGIYVAGCPVRAFPGASRTRCRGAVRSFRRLAGCCWTLLVRSFFVCPAGKAHAVAKPGPAGPRTGRSYARSFQSGAAASRFATADEKPTGATDDSCSDSAIAAGPYSHTTGDLTANHGSRSCGRRTALPTHRSARHPVTSAGRDPVGRRRMPYHCRWCPRPAQASTLIDARLALQTPVVAPSTSHAHRVTRSGP